MANYASSTTVSVATSKAEIERICDTQSPTPDVQLPVAWPKSCDGIEQDAFEAWAASEKMLMDTHPLHWLFLDPKTNAARQGWKAGLRHAADRCATLSSPPTVIEGGSGEWTRKRWDGVPALVEQITSEEGASVTFTGPNPDFNGMPNECIEVVRGPSWESETFRADTLADCLKAALNPRPPDTGKGEG